MTTRRVLTRVALGAAAVAAVVLVRLTLFAPEKVPVRVAAVDKGRVEETVTNSRAGTVKARRRAKLAPEIGGRVLELPRRRGRARAQGRSAAARRRLAAAGAAAPRAGRAGGRVRAARAGLPRVGARRTRARAHAHARAAGPRRERPGRSGRERGARRRGRLPGGEGGGRPRGLGDSPREGRARQDGAARALRRRRGRHLHRGGRVDHPLAARAADPADPRPDRHAIDLRERADGRGGLGPDPQGPDGAGEHRLAARQALPRPRRRGRALRARPARAEPHGRDRGRARRRLRPRRACCPAPPPTSR